MERQEYKVRQTADDRFAVVSGAGGQEVTVAEFHGEQPALTAAAALNSGPVRSIGGGRWTERGSGSAERGTMENAA